MSRPWRFLDLESTGVDPYTDRIVEMAFYEVLAGEPGLLLVTRVNPGRPIPAGASEVHGIYDKHVAGMPEFDAWAAEVQRILQGAVLCGYSTRRFDTILIDRELRMAGQPGLERDAEGRIVQPEVDPFGIWQQCERRNLATAARRFADLDLEQAHSAAADAEVLPAVLMGMIREFGLAPELEELVRLSKPEGAVDRDGKFVQDSEGIVRFNFAQVRGQPVHEEPGFLEWMLARDFSPETLAYARQYLDECYDPHGPGQDHEPELAF